MTRNLTGTFRQSLLISKKHTFIISVKSVITDILNPEEALIGGMDLQFFDSKQRYDLLVDSFNRNQTLTQVAVMRFTDASQEILRVHTHPYVEIIFLSRGSISIATEGRLLAMKENSIIIIPPEVVHATIVTNQNSLFDRTLLWIPQDHLAKLLARYSPEKRWFFCELKHVSVLNGAIRRYVEIQSSLQKLTAALLSRDEGADILCHCYLMEILVYLDQSLINGVQPFKQPKNTLLQNLLDYVDGHYTEQALCMDEIAKALFLSKSYISKVFKENTGVSLYSYITKMRLNAALRMIREGARVLEACNACGFGDYSSFHKAFQKEYNISPIKCRKANPV